MVKKKSFDDMLSDDGDVRVTVYKNIIDVLSEKLNNDNIRMRDHQLEKSEYGSRLLGFERQLRSVCVSICQWRWPQSEAI